MSPSEQPETSSPDDIRIQAVCRRATVDVALSWIDIRVMRLGSPVGMAGRCSCSQGGGDAWTKAVLSRRARQLARRLKRHSRPARRLVPGEMLLASDFCRMAWWGPQQVDAENSWRQLGQGAKDRSDIPSENQTATGHEFSRFSCDIKNRAKQARLSQKQSGSIERGGSDPRAAHSGLGARISVTDRRLLPGFFARQKTRRGHGLLSATKQASEWPASEMTPWVGRGGPSTLG